MANSIFSTYSKAENRVTSTVLAVFEKLNSSTVTQILQVVLEDSTMELIQYENQVKATDSVPDGRIKGLFDYILETKVFPNSVNKFQIENHCKMLEYDFSKLLVLTPDFEKPKELKELEPKFPGKIFWGNFDKINEGIETVLSESLILLDREKFLLTELKEFIINEKLIAEDYSRKALIVPAGSAWEFYQRYGIYRCQPNRTFQPSSFMGFYSNGEIKEFFPKILGYFDSLNIQEDDLDKAEVVTVNGFDEMLIRHRIAQSKTSLMKGQWNGNYKYIILTEMNDDLTFKIENPIVNDKTSYSNKGTAFVQKQTYLNIDDLKGKQFTSEL